MKLTAPLVESAKLYMIVFAVTLVINRIFAKVISSRRPENVTVFAVLSNEYEPGVSVANNCFMTIPIYNAIAIAMANASLAPPGPAGPVAPVAPVAPAGPVAPPPLAVEEIVNVFPL